MGSYSTDMDLLHDPVLNVCIVGQEKRTIKVHIYRSTSTTCQSRDYLTSALKGYPGPFDMRYRWVFC